MRATLCAVEIDAEHVGELAHHRLDPGGVVGEVRSPHEHPVERSSYGAPRKPPRAARRAPIASPRSSSTSPRRAATEPIASSMSAR
jgi:hypothetical protein